MDSKQNSQKTERTFSSLKDFSDAFFREHVKKGGATQKKRAGARKKRATPVSGKT
jgi:hypothetical protein